MIRFTAVVCLVLFVSGSVSARDYTGADRGTLILSLGVTEKALDGYQLYYKRAGEARDMFWGDPHLTYNPHSQLPDTPDYTGEETGLVHVIHLKPGDYEIYTFSLVKVVGAGERNWEPQKAFSIPFTIKPGEGTYVGDFNGFGIFEAARAGRIFRPVRPA